MSRAARAVDRIFKRRPSGAVRAESFAMPLATRTWRDLTPEEALSAMAQAELGAIRQACNFCDALLTDDRIAGVLDTRVLGMLGFPIYFEGDELAEWYKLAPESELANILKWGLFFGVSFARIEADGFLRWWHPRSFDQDRCTGDWYVTTSEGREKVDRCNGTWLVFEPYGSFESALQGLWVSLALPVLMKLYSTHDRARASEVFGSAMIVGTASEGASEPKRQQWLRDLRSLARSARIVLPDGYKLDLLEAQGQTWGIYQQTIQWADDAITIRIAGQLVTTVGAGAFSRGDVHEKIARSLLCFGEATFSTCLATYYVPYVWGVDSVPRWRTTSPDEVIGEGTALKAFADGVTAMNAVLAPDGLCVDVSGYAKKYGITTKALSVAAPAQAAEDPDAPANDVSLMAAAARVPEGFEVHSRVAIPTKPPTAFRIYKYGANVTDYGVRYFTDESAILVMRANGNRPVMIDLEHLSLDKRSPAFDPDARGWARLEVRNDGLWAVNVKWNADGRRRIVGLLQRSISPVSISRRKDGVIIALHNCALTAMPATHDGVILIAASRGMNMDQLRKLLGLPPEASIDDIIAVLGLDASASAADTLNALAKAFETAGGTEDAGDGGADETAEGDAPADGTTEEAADAPADGSAVNGTTDDKAKQEAASKARPKVAQRPRVPTTEDRIARLEREAREVLIASKPLTPREKALLAHAPLSDVRKYVSSAPSAPAGRPTAKGNETTIASASVEAVAKATGRSVKDVQASIKAANG